MNISANLMQEFIEKKSIANKLLTNNHNEKKYLIVFSTFSFSY